MTVADIDRAKHLNPGQGTHRVMSGRHFNLLGGEAARKFTKELTHNLVDYNRSVGPPEAWQELVISVEADDRAALGGLTGYTHWQWLFVERLWVLVTARRKGIGAQLLAKAEQAARDRGCVGSWLDTFSFQARDFLLPTGIRRVWVALAFSARSFATQ